MLKDILQFAIKILSKPFKLDIEFVFNDVTIQDKLVYIYFECLCYHLISKGFKVRVYFETSVNISTAGINYSPIQYLNPPNGKYSLEEFKRYFLKDLSLNHFRLWIDKDKDPSVLSGDIIIFLKHTQLFSQKMLYSIANTICELAGNAIEHGESDCLIDIDIAPNYSHQNKGSLSFMGLNVVVLNFSNKNIGDLVQQKVLSGNDYGEKYSKLQLIRNRHSKYFTNQYTEEVFWMLASFQDEISGRLDTSISGGKGSMELIKSIIDYSENSYCYVMSGRYTLSFEKEFLKKDPKGFIPFNDSSFETNPPKLELCSKSMVRLPGVGYNLNFVIQETE